MYFIMLINISNMIIWLGKFWKTDQKKVIKWRH